MIKLLPALGVNHLEVVAGVAGQALTVALLAGVQTLGKTPSQHFSKAGKNNKCLKNCSH